MDSVLVLGFELGFFVVVGLFGIFEDVDEVFSLLKQKSQDWLS